MNFYKQTLIVLLYFLVFIIKKTSCKDKQDKGRHKHTKCYGCCGLVEQPPSLWMLLTVTMLTALLFGILLGVVKGILGLLCCAPVGMWGLGALIDLPRPLSHYQERDLADTPVVYDQIGWPVHPETGKRSVRAISKKTEFYLNVIFFLAYPLTVLVTMCSACCFEETCGCEDENYRYVNTIVFAKVNEKDFREIQIKKGDMYSDDDSTEEKDTNYVICQMRQSEQSLRQNKTGNCGHCAGAK